METVGYAELPIVPTLKGLSSSGLGQVEGQLAAAGRRGGQKYGDAVSKEAGGRIKTGLGTVFREAATPFVGILAGAGIFQGLKSIVGLASNAQQSVGGVQAVFKQYAGSVIADSRRADQALGLSATQYQELATITGALLKNQGLSDFADQSKRLIKVGADLAAQYGGSTKDAVEALSAALRGETDPIERYGISLNQSAIQAELLNRGQNKLKGTALITASAQARLAIITRQSADAQGQFAAQSDTLAERQQRLSAQFANERAELGQRLLPAISGVTGFLNDSAIPAIDGTASAIGGLPPEVKAATAAFIAYKVAQSSGLTGKISSGFAVTGNLLDALTTKYGHAKDAAINASQATFVVGSSGTVASAGVGKLSAALAAVRAGATGTGTALKRGLGGAVSLLGGPWGIAFAGAAVLATKFYQRQQEAKGRVDALTASLNKQTGAVTQDSVTQAFKTLKDSGAIDAAQKLGIGLDQVRLAATGNKGAMSALKAQLDSLVISSAQYGGSTSDYTGKQIEASNAARVLRTALFDQSSDLSKSRAQWQQQADFVGQSASATDQAASSNLAAGASFRSLATDTNSARTAVQKLLDAENKRRNANLQNRQDRLALIKQEQATREEATNAPQIADIQKQIRDVQQQAADRRKQLQTDGSFSSGSSDRRIRDLERRLAEEQAKLRAAKPGSRDSIRSSIASTQSSLDAARSSASHSGGKNSSEIAASYADEASKVAELRKQLAQYDRTLNDHKPAGQANLDQLYQLANQWNNTSEKVKNAKGAYADIRQSFITSAELMGATQKRAKHLADTLLDLPLRAATRIETPGMKEALANVARLRAELALNKFNSTGGRSVAGAFAISAHADGGLIGGRGTGTSDSNLALLSRGEYVQRERAVSYYGVDFMRAVNDLQFPRYAEGGPVGSGGSVAPVHVAGGTTIHIAELHTPDYDGFMRRAQTARRQAGIGGRRTP